jgi:hypothetical protein
VGRDRSLMHGLVFDQKFNQRYSIGDPESERQQGSRSLERNEFRIRETEND